MSAAAALPSFTHGDDALVASWLQSLHAKSPGTRTIYRSNLGAFRRWLAEHHPNVSLLEVTRHHCRAYFTDLHALPIEGNTRRNRWTAMRAFYRWAVDDDELDESPMTKVAQPKATDKPVSIVSDADLTALLAACKGRDFLARRDMAIIRTMTATGLRVAETAGLALGDVDLANRVLVVRKGKGDKARIVRVDPATAAAIDRYLRARARHRLAASPGLWLGRMGQLSIQAFQLLLDRRAALAGIGHIHPHQLRHTWAHRMKRGGAPDEVVMELGGWGSSEVMRRYGSSVATERALAAYDAVNPMGSL